MGSTFINPRWIPSIFHFPLLILKSLIYKPHGYFNLRWSCCQEERRKFSWRFPLEIRFWLGKCTVFDLTHLNGTNSPRTISVKTKNRKAHSVEKKGNTEKGQKVYLWSETISCLYILIINTCCRIVALSAVVKFMIVEVLNDKELPNNCVCKETQLSSKDGWDKCYYSCALPTRIFNNSVLLPGKDMHIGKVKLLSYKKVFIVTVIRLS